MENRYTLMEQLRLSMGRDLNIYEAADFLIPTDEKNEIRSRLEDEYASRGIDIGTADQPAYMGGQFAVELASLLSSAINSGLHVYLLSIAPSVCPVYCDLKKRGALDAEELQLATTILDCLIMAHTRVPMPFVHMAKYATRKGLMDRYCNCS